MISMPETLHDKINIFGYNYNIIYCNTLAEVDTDGKDEIWGEVYFDKREIRLFNNNKNFDMWQVLWHEIFHVLARIFHIDDENVEEEDNEILKRKKAKFLETLVDGFALGVTKVLFDNKLKFIDKENNGVAFLPLHHINIFGYVYFIESFKVLKDVSPTKKYMVEGCTSFQNQIIRIYNNGKSFSTWQILWHEIFHVISHCINLDYFTVEEEKDDKLKILKKEYLESLIDKFALGVINILFDNKLDFSKNFHE